MIFRVICVYFIFFLPDSFNSLHSIFEGKDNTSKSPKQTLWSIMIERKISNVLFKLCTFTSALSVVISFYTIVSHLMAYRMPQEQRMCIRILFMVPLFAITTYITSSGIISTFYSKIFLQPIQEIYESFIIYTFFTYLIYILGGERKILMETAWKNKSTVRHPLIGKILPSVDISNPKDFLFIKRGILQYVWLKPFFIVGNLVVDFNETDTNADVWVSRLKFWLLIGYNISATLSLYELAVFWRCLYNELRQFGPWPKFLCVKLIIFVSYWQSILLMILQHFGVFKQHVNLKEEDMGYIYQNVLLCLEMIPFAIGHLVAFSNEPYTYRKKPESSRLSFTYALKDCLGNKDLVVDSYNTFFGTEYNYRNFDAAKATLNSKADTRTRNARITEGLRFSNKGKDQYWLEPKHIRKKKSLASFPSHQQMGPTYGSTGNGSLVDTTNNDTRTSDTSGNLSAASNTQNRINSSSDDVLARNQIDEPWADFMEGYYDEYIPVDETYNKAVVYDIKGYKYLVEKKQEQMKLLKHKNGPALSADKNRVKSLVDDFNVFDRSNEMPSP